MSVPASSHGHVGIGGLGLICCYGQGVAAAVAAVHAGRAGGTPLTGLPVPFTEPIPVNQIPAALWVRSRAGVEQAILDVVRQSLPRPGRDLTDCALLLGTSGLLFSAEAAHRSAGDSDAVPDEGGLRGPGDVANSVAAQLGVGGPVMTFSTACSSAANAVLAGADLIRQGIVARALVIGIEGLSAITLSGFYSLMLLDPDGCRPFDAQRRGLQLGEAVGALLLERRDRADGDRVIGGANRCDTHHITSAAPGGEMMRLTMADALAAAAIEPRDVAGIKAHGTGSPDSDLAEAAALHTLFAGQPPAFTGLKRYLGHTLGAGGVVETALLLGCLRAGFLPATAGFTQPDPALALRPLSTMRAAQPGYYLCNFFGFGGNYASLVLAHAV